VGVAADAVDLLGVDLYQVTEAVLERPAEWSRCCTPC
jgi:hypothetical protein